MQDALLEDDLNEYDSILDDESESKTYQSMALYAFTINYIFGAGVLGVPYAIANGGIVASSLLLIFSSTLSLLSMVWILETQERAKYQKGTRLMVDYGELCGMYLGERALRMYEIALSIFVISSAWMYASIFAVSIANTFPLSSNATLCDISGHTGPLWNVSELDCWIDYLVYLALFALLMGILVRTDIGSMKNLQLGLTCVGLVALLTMVITVLIALPTDGAAQLDRKTKIFNPSKFGTVFGTFVFAQLCHHGIPLLSSIPKNPRIVRPVFVGVISTTTVMYLLLGISCAIFFGVDPSFRHDPKSLNKLINLNWQDYTAESPRAGFIGNFISIFIRIYPAVTCGAAFPLYAITLGNSWYSATHRDGDQEEEKGHYYWYAMTPSIIAAGVMADISFMLVFVGLSGMFVAFVLPPLMHLKSRTLVPEMETTMYTWHFSQPIFCYICLGFACLGSIYTIIELFI